MMQRRPHIQTVFNLLKKRLFTSLVVLWCSPLWAASITYQIEIPQPHTHMIQVEMTLEGVRGNAVIGMPVWTPGSYLIREFERHVQDITAMGADGRTLSIEKLDKNHWKIDGSWQDKQIVVRYRIYAFEHSVRTSFVNADHALINGASVFMYWQDHLSEQHTVHVTLPPQWSTISTSLPPFQIPGNTTFTADDYDELVDSPMELGNQHEISFQVDGKPHVIALYGLSNYDDARLVQDFTNIIQVEKALWGDLPYKHYLFIFHLGNGGGGLEHKNSSVMFANRWSFTDQKSYHRLLSLVAHEFFHTWNIKRLRPAGLGPFNYDEEAYTKNLWLVEGLTSYYDEFVLLRAGFYEPEDYFRALTGQINSLEGRPGRFHQSLTESSWDAWIKYYRPNEHSKNSTISYYNKGALIGMLLNLKILAATNGENSLDDVMRLLYRQHYSDRDVPFSAQDIQQAAESVAGTKLTDFFQNYISGTTPLPYSEYLNRVGLRIDSTQIDSSAFLGIEARDSNGRYMIRRVIENTPAWEAGLNVDDELIALDGFRVRRFPPSYLKECKPGERIIATVSRDDILQDIPVILGVAPTAIRQISRIDTATHEQKILYHAWLNQDWPSDQSSP
ncbi:MAG: PDZ domain-containing protein [Candidatus Marinimicrobia bacterium]|nr:PDZ domain-containing protein [Candidatus Neomarinimicrobiota bacterium]MCF7840757.1 PDZ domain-containing protein [Candidatus Neomarinimicrobiota bacterium]MCF7902695.1 PDZ domain-containing protein [Candidatus Neomarinimicrobiota bacterium]